MNKNQYNKLERNMKGNDQCVKPVDTTHHIALPGVRFCLQGVFSSVPIVASEVFPNFTTQIYSCLCNYNATVSIS